ncbi:hypothetical protein JCM19037_1989 [Geomicrobium sp. JCM 19037]|uniref:hypothetical protein n=1 Tax=Geomicrobium sp. JCM 19037 TaxID=1460634 RepID=UPI00045F446E|nr:hypothetical protein [Geomicrobium sp. JCM 19037]GAK03650.1 hypothetical protein JCM19037_1989 [Geomicrobium sp. JCM 19037]
MIGVLLRKEWIETTRSYRIIWLPLLFVLLGIMQPLTSYYLSDLLEQFGGLPDGAMFVIPTPTARWSLLKHSANIHKLARSFSCWHLWGRLVGKE